MGRDGIAVRALGFGRRASGGRPRPRPGALAWLWVHGPRAVPVPGFRTVTRAEENAGALPKGPLTRPG
ncbi:hypothetical protein [Streptomyces sp. NPDC051132]|uniref:hypothetical protein n=1 Tax=unclassified Streptomyces TaxID=2593676 RepID=UPI003422BDB9